MRTLLRALLILILVVSAAPLAGANPSISMEAEAGFEGRAKTGKWVPVTVTVRNDGAEIAGALQFEITTNNGENRHTGTYRTPVVVPAGATKRVSLLLPSEGMTIPEVRLMVGDTEVAAVRPALESTWDLLVGVLGVEPADLPSIAGMRIGERPVRLIPLGADSFPSEPLLLENLDGLLLNRFALGELSEAQRQALYSWVEAGGLLIAATGPEASRLSGLAPWAPFQVTGTESQAVPGVGVAPLAQLELDPAKGWRVVRRAGDAPLVARLPKGAGSVLLLSFDPALEPFSSWSGLPELFASFFPNASDFGMGMGMGMGMPGKMQMALLDSLNHLSVGQFPSAKGLLYVLIAYAALIGPVHFLLLRGFRKTAWGLLTLPVLIMAGAGGAWAYVQRSRASDILVSSVTIIEGQRGGGALRVKGLAGFYLPPGSSQTVSLGDALLSPMPPPYMHYFGGPPPVVDHRSTFELGRSVYLAPREEWMVRPVAADALLPNAGAVIGDLRVEQFRITGRITNNLPFALKDIILVSGTNFQQISRLEPGASADVSLVLPAFNSQQYMGYNPIADAMGQAYSFGIGGLERPTAEHLEKMRRQPIIWSAGHALSMATGPERPPVALVGWTDYQPLPIQVGGKEIPNQGLTLYAQPLEVSYGSGEFTVPQGFLTPRQVEWGGNNEGWREPLYPGWSLPKGANVTLHFSVPLEVAHRVTELEVKASVLDQFRATPTYPIAVRLQRWSDGAWVPIQVDSSGSATLQNPAAFISPDGAVRLQVEQLIDERLPLGVPGITVRGKEAR